jgi:hypothetical protein
MRNLVFEKIDLGCYSITYLVKFNVRAGYSKIVLSRKRGRRGGFKQQVVAHFSLCGGAG